MHGWLDRDIMLISLCAPSSAGIQAQRRTPEPIEPPLHDGKITMVCFICKYDFVYEPARNQNSFQAGSIGQFMTAGLILNQEADYGYAKRAGEISLSDSPFASRSAGRHPETIRSAAARPRAGAIMIP